MTEHQRLTERRDPRYPLRVCIQISNISDQSEDILKNSLVDVENISTSGIGFCSAVKLKTGHFYDFNLTLWNNNKINTVVQIVRSEPDKNRKIFYGGIFIGLSQIDYLAIKTYEILL